MKFTDFGYFRHSNRIIIIKFMKKKILLILFIFFAWFTHAQLPVLPDTISSCTDTFVILDAGEGFLSYSWNTGQTTQTIVAAQNGLYSVICVGDGGLILEDSCLVSLIKAKIIQSDTIICFRDSIQLCVDADTLRYVWSTGDTTSCIWFKPNQDSTSIYVSFSDSLGITHCMDSVQVFMHTPILQLDTVMQINTGCPGTCKGQLLVTPSGGLKPYRYFWDTSPAQYDSVVYGLCEGKYNLILRDSLNCKIDTLLNVKVFSMPEVEIKFEPDTGTYIKYPIVTFSFDNKSIDSIQIIEWFWNFGDTTYSTDAAPEKVFDMVRSYDIWLRYTTDNECVDSVKISFEVKDVKLTIPNIFTPNGDFINEFFQVTDLDKFISNEIQIFNRWGKKVYETENYRGDWNGENLPDGVYFYVIKAQGYFGREIFKGSITILRR